MIIIAIMFAQNSVGSLCCDVWHKCLTFVCFSGLVLPSSVGYHLKLNNLCDFLICFISWSGLSHTYHLTFRHVLDKDGISAAVVLAEMATYLSCQGFTLTEQLNNLYKRYCA